MSTVSTAISLLTSFITLVGLVFGLREFTKASRSRKTAEFWKATLAESPLGSLEKKEILDNYRHALSYSFTQSWIDRNYRHSIVLHRIYAFLVFLFPASLAAALLLQGDVIAPLLGTIGIVLNSPGPAAEAFKIRFISRRIQENFLLGEPSPSELLSADKIFKPKREVDLIPRAITFAILICPGILIACVGYISTASVVTLLTGQQNNIAFIIFGFALAFSITALFQSRKTLESIWVTLP